MPGLNNGLKYLCLVFFVACWVWRWKFFPGSVKSKWSWGSAVSCPMTGMSDRISQIFPVLMQCMCISLCSIDQCESIPIWYGSLGKFFIVAFVWYMLRHCVQHLYISGIYATLTWGYFANNKKTFSHRWKITVKSATIATYFSGTAGVQFVCVMQLSERCL